MECLRKFETWPGSYKYSLQIFEENVERMDISQEPSENLLEEPRNFVGGKFSNKDYLVGNWSYRKSARNLIY